jgi:DNA processing protein
MCGVVTMKGKEYEWARICSAVWGDNRLLYQLVRVFEEPERIIAAGTRKIISATGTAEEAVGEFMVRLHDADPPSLRRLRDSKVRCVSLYDESYPEVLKHTSAPAPVLFIRGDLPSDFSGFSVVGSRRATGKGREIASRISAELTDRGFTIVSGMARGIDSASHRACLDSGGRTIAVLGCGIDISYPPENCNLANEISSHGAIVTEYPPGYPPLARNFPARNRIIAGLSSGVLVVEAAKRSGALITAYLALDEGREVFAIPGDIDKPRSEGANELIKKGAKLVQDVDDILDELPPVRLTDVLSCTQSSGRSLQLEACEARVMDSLRDDARTIDQLMRVLPDSPGEIMKSIMELELKGLITRDHGGLLRARLR